MIKLEADYDKQFKEQQTQTGVRIKWDWGLNKKRTATFIFPKEDNVRLVPGDELKLKFDKDGHEVWKTRGHIVRIT